MSSIMTRMLSQQEAVKRFKNASLTLLSSYEGNNRDVQASCHCGAVFTTKPAYVFCGDTSSCGCTKARATSDKQRIDISGQRFGLLVATQALPFTQCKQGKTLWKCHCDCGNHRIVRLSHLRSGASQSCGCLNTRKGVSHPNWRGYGQIPGAYWCALIVGAVKRQMPIEISIEEAWQVFELQEGKCALSGVNLSFGSRHKRENTMASLDRIDNSRGYVTGNMQWLHKAVNKMKREFPLQWFMLLCELVTTPLTSSEPAMACMVDHKHGCFRGLGNLCLASWHRIVGTTNHGKDSSRKRKIALKITIHQAWERFLEQRGRCALTGLELDWNKYLGMDATGRKSYHWGSASLDRINSRKGYTINNIQWVHKDVNLMKWEFDEIDFKNWCRLVATYGRKKGDMSNC